MDTELDENKYKQEDDFCYIYSNSSGFSLKENIAIVRG
jgi:hypothetical protein